MMEPFSPPAAWLGASSLQGVGRGRRQRILAESIKKENIIYFYSLSVNYNNRSPALSNECQNGINCRRWATIIDELTKYIVMSNSAVGGPP